MVVLVIIVVVVVIVIVVVLVVVIVGPMVRHPIFSVVCETMVQKTYILLHSRDLRGLNDIGRTAADAIEKQDCRLKLLHLCRDFSPTTRPHSMQ